jgi:hypothetical protein
MSPLADLRPRLPPTADRPELAARMLSTGRVLLPGVLPMDAVDELDRLLMDLAAAADPADGKTVVLDAHGRVGSVHGLDRHSEEVFDLARHPDLRQLAVDLLGRRVAPFLTETYQHPASAAARPPHQDQAFRQEHFDDEVAVGFWIPLTPITADDAPPEFARPCPQPYDLLPHRELGDRVFDEKELRADPSELYDAVLAEPGDLLAYHAYAIWRVRPGQPGRPRRVFTSHYRTSPER